MVFSNGGIFTAWKPPFARYSFIIAHFSQNINPPGRICIEELAEAYGLRGFRVTTPEEMEQAFAEALACGTGAVIDCTLDIDEMVSPMVAAGSPITDFLLSEGGSV